MICGITMVIVLVKVADKPASAPANADGADSSRGSLKV